MKKTVIRLLDNITEVALFEGKLSIFKDNNIEAKPTDLAILSGGVRDRLGYTYYWTNTTGKDYIAIITSEDIYSYKHFQADRFAKSPTIRPVIEIDSIEDKSIIKGNLDKDEIVYMGEYPLFIETDEDKIIELERLARLSKRHMKTDKKYNLDDKNLYQEYVLGEDKYVPFVCNNEEQLLSNGEECVKDQTYWLKVSNVPWYVEREKGLLVSVYGLLAGINYWLENNGESNYEKSNMASFLTDKMVDDIMTISTIRKESSYNDYLTNNPFNLQNSELSYTDLARELLNSGISPFLHGDTGVGKSARVMEMDPDAKIIYLCNQTIDSINGKSVFVPPVVKKEEDGSVTVLREGMMQDKKPTWLKSCEKRETNDGKMHLVFFDEITNAPLSIQGFCYNIILEREVNGIWKLPPDFGVIAAGNEIDESLSSNGLAEPLFSRFGHIYISDNVDKWLAWAIKKHIHPAIIAYMTFTNGINLRTKYNGKTPNADPRKWELASNALYSEGNVSLLYGLLGEEVTKSFIGFLKCKTISLEDVINGNYDDNAFIMDTNQKYVTALSLSRVNIDNFEKAYNFMEKVGEEPLALFENLWAKDNQERLEKIREIEELRRLRRGQSRKEELARRVSEYQANGNKHLVKKIDGLGDNK